MDLTKALNYDILEDFSNYLSDDVYSENKQLFQFGKNTRPDIQ